MIKRLQTLPKIKQHIRSLLFVLLYMAVTIFTASFYCNTADHDLIIIILIFVFGLILVASNTVTYFYGIFCSLFSVLWLWLTEDILPHRIFITFLGMAAIVIFINNQTSHFAAQSSLIAEREKQLAEAEMEKNRANLLRAISHDLRTPLSGILGNSLIFLENQAILSEQEKTQIVTNIRESSDWLINMVENLLSITRIREDGPTINTTDEIVEEVIGEALQKMEKRHPGFAIHVKIPDEIILLPMDVVLIEQVLLNLLENAMRHSGSQEPADIIVDNEPDRVVFTVRDYGSGIPENMLNNLFEGTYYSAVHAPDAQKGMGIGLVICKTIITAHQGTIVGRNHEHGAEFIFSLPKRKEENTS